MRRAICVRCARPERVLCHDSSPDAPGIVASLFSMLARLAASHSLRVEAASGHSLAFHCIDLFSPREWASTLHSARIRRPTPATSN